MLLAAGALAGPAWAGNGKAITTASTGTGTPATSNANAGNAKTNARTTTVANPKTTTGATPDASSKTTAGATSTPSKRGPMSYPGSVDTNTVPERSGATPTVPSPTTLP